MDAAAAEAPTDPEERALLYVMQWMHEMGYGQALSALQEQVGLLFEESKLPQASRLMTMVWKEVEAELEDLEDAATVARRAERERLLRGGDNDFPSMCTHVVEGVHPSNIICIRLAAGAEQVLTGSGDSYVRLVGFDGRLVWATQVGSGAVLSLDVQPTAGPSDHPSPSRERLVLASCMDGSTHVLSLATGARLASSKPHGKYVVRAAWSGDGTLIASGSHDETWALQRLSRRTAGDGDGATAASSSGSGSGSGSDWVLEHVMQVPMTSAVTDLTFLSDGRRVVVSARDTNYLRMWDTANPQVAETSAINMNESGDDHLSFTARALAPSPCGEYLLVATDTARVLLLRTADWSQLGSVFGPPIPDKFFNPAALWHRSSHYVMLVGPAAEVLVLHVGTGRVVARLQGHKTNVRGLDYDAARNLLATCSFDKTCRVYSS